MAMLRNDKLITGTDLPDPRTILRDTTRCCKWTLGPTFVRLGPTFTEKGPTYEMPAKRVPQAKKANDFSKMDGME